LQKPFNRNENLTIITNPPSHQDDTTITLTHDINTVTAIGKETTTKQQIPETLTMTLIAVTIAQVLQIPLTYIRILINVVHIPKTHLIMIIGPSSLTKLVSSGQTFQNYTDMVR
jgi:hypothetical protein